MCCKIIILILLIFASNSFGEFSTGAEFLNRAYGARPSSMGDAFVAISDDLNSFYFNPAGLTRIQSSKLSTFFVKNFEDTYYGSIAYSLSPMDIGTFGINFMTFQGGKIEIISIDGSSNSVNAEGDYALTIGWGKEFWEGVSIGVNAKVIGSILAEESKAFAVAGDVGVLFGKLYESLCFGISVQNFGTKMKYKGGIATGDYGESLPLTLRLGSAYGIRLAEEHRLMTAIDGFMRLRNETTLPIGGNIGVEYWLKDMFAFRTGYKLWYNKGIKDKTQGYISKSQLSFGVGAKINRYEFDYGIEPHSVLGIVHLISLTYNL